MADVACFCGCLYSFDSGAAACPGCGRYAAVRAGTALTRAGDDQPRGQRAAAPCDGGQTAASVSFRDQVLVSALLDGFSAGGA
jgi:hypothetical protein